MTTPKTPSATRNTTPSQRAALTSSPAPECCSDHSTGGTTYAASVSSPGAAATLPLWSPNDHWNDGTTRPLSIATPPMDWDPCRLADLLHELDNAPSLFCVRRLLNAHAHELPATTRADLLAEQVEVRGG
jgi:hypothetical protein